MRSPPRPARSPRVTSCPLAHPLSFCYCSLSCGAVPRKPQGEAVCGVSGLSALGAKPPSNGPICTECTRCTSPIHVYRTSPHCGTAPAARARNLVRTTGLTGSGHSDLKSPQGVGHAWRGSRAGRIAAGEGGSLANAADHSVHNEGQSGQFWAGRRFWATAPAAILGTGPRMTGRLERCGVDRLGIPCPGSGW